jgi:hypothetical protein
MCDWRLAMRLQIITQVLSDKNRLADLISDLLRQT